MHKYTPFIEQRNILYQKCGRIRTIQVKKQHTKNYYKGNTMKTKTIYIADDGRVFEDESACVAHEATISGLPKEEIAYLYTHKVKNIASYNPDYNEDAKCECGHAYYRHFDTYEDMYPCGCKYCSCGEFVAKKA